jgi:hypothetical protein
MKRFFSAWIAVLLSQTIMAQSDTSNYKVVNGDTIRDIRILDPILINAGMDDEKINAYKLLKKRVIKVMPYAKLAAYKMRLMEDNLTLKKTKKEKKKYIKQCEESMKDLYMAQLKDLTIEEGKVLMKLVHRETGKTTWEIMKGYRGGAEAIFWQAFGSFYGHDMKTEYDPSLDYQIENIIRVEKLE